MFEPALDQLLDYRAQLLARLERQPAQMAALLAAIPEREWYHRPDGAARTVHQIAAHVRDLERLAFLPRIRLILDEDQPTLPPFVSHDWSSAQYQPGEPLTTILAAWAEARAEVLDRLPAPAGPGWSRLGFHPPSGNRTLQWWAERIYTHARDHMRPLGAGRGGAFPEDPRQAA